MILNIAIFISLVVFAGVLQSAVELNKASQDLTFSNLSRYLSFQICHYKSAIKLLYQYSISIVALCCVFTLMIYGIQVAKPALAVLCINAFLLKKYDSLSDFLTIILMLLIAQAAESSLQEYVLISVMIYLIYKIITKKFNDFFELNYLYAASAILVHIYFKFNGTGVVNKSDSLVLLICFFMCFSARITHRIIKRNLL